MPYSVIIPSKTAANLVPCVRAIREAGETCRIIVVDDGVDWDDPHFRYWVEYEQVDPNAPACASGIFYGDADVARNQKTLHSGLRLVTPAAGSLFYRVTAPKPFVFSRNVNMGIALAETDDVIVMNDDALLKTPMGFARMAAEAGHGFHGMIAAACNNVGNVNQHWKRHSPISEDHLMREEPRMVCFVCVYIPRSTINTVGLLDERFVGYGLDDDDYSLRVRNAGLKLAIFDGCYVDHGSLTSSFRGGPQTGGDFRPNMKLFIEKWGTDNWNRDKAHSEFADLFPKEVK